MRATRNAAALLGPRAIAPTTLLIVIPLTLAATAAAEPTYAAAYQVDPAGDELPEDAKLNQEQRLYRDWAHDTFRPFIDPAPYQGWSETAKADKTAEWILDLDTPEIRDLIPAINGLAAVRSKEAAPAMLKIAVDPGETDSRVRWMATRALGLLGDKGAVPELVHLTYHYNAATRRWAQISLVRLTGQNFGRDLGAWKRWWEDEGGTPPMSEETIQWTERTDLADPEKQQESDRRFYEMLKKRAH